MKYKAIVLFIIVLFFSFAGCQQNQSSKTSSESQTETLKATSDEATNEDTSYAEHAVTYSYDEATETLTFSGNGSLCFDFNSDAYINLCEIEKPTHVVVSSGITSVGPGALAFLPEIDEYNVEAKSHFDKICSIKLPNTLVEISECSFESCHSLKKIEIPNSVKRIGAFACKECISLKETVIPEGVTEIGDMAFAFCDGLESIVFPSTLNSINCNICDNCKSLSKVVVSSGTEFLKEYSFNDCISLKEVVLGDSIKVIEHNAFRNCSTLDDITLPNSINEIQHYAFCGCENLTSILVPSSVELIGKHAFGYKLDDEKIDSFVIKGYKNTAAEKYAKENGFEFVALD